MSKLIRCVVLAVLLASPWTMASAADVAAGNVVLLTGRGTALSHDGAAIRDLHKDDAVHSGELINAANNSYVNMRFTDGSFILLRPNTRLLIKSYSNPPPAAAPVAEKKTTASASPTPSAPTPRTAPEVFAKRAFFQLLKGGFRAVSGLIGHVDHDEYRIETPVATIGIRGTDYYVYQCDENCTNDPVIAELIGNGKLPPNIAGGTLVSVYKGAVMVDSYTGHSTLVRAGQFLLTLPDGTQILLPIEPQFLRVTPFPDPITLCATE